MNEHVKFTYLSRPELVSKLVEKGISTSVYHVGKLLKKLGLSKRKMAKTGTHKQVLGRNEQFENIENLVKDYGDRGQIVISMDGKKKELLGQLYRNGKVYSNKA
jgi:arginine repressor